jgi:hypothetical protein
MRRTLRPSDASRGIFASRCCARCTDLASAFAREHALAFAAAGAGGHEDAAGCACDVDAARSMRRGAWRAFHVPAYDRTSRRSLSVWRAAWLGHTLRSASLSVASLRSAPLRDGASLRSKRSLARPGRGRWPLERRMAGRRVRRIRRSSGFAGRREPSARRGRAGVTMRRDVMVAGRRAELAMRRVGRIGGGACGGLLGLYQCLVRPLHNPG